MDPQDVFEKRRSVRKFKPTPVPDSLIRNILQAASLAPTARNLQPWEFVVVRDEGRRKQLAEIVSPNGSFMVQAPVCVVVFCRNTKYYLEDGSAAATQALLNCVSLGLASCWVAGDKKEYCENVKKFLHVPADYKLICLLPVGYADETPHTQKRPLDEMIHTEQF